MLENSIEIINKNGEPTNYSVLFSFDSKTEPKTFIAYTDSFKENTDQINVYYAYYENNNSSNLKTVSAKEDIELLDSILSDFEKELNLNIKK